MYFISPYVIYMLFRNTARFFLCLLVFQYLGRISPRRFEGLGEDSDKSDPEGSKSGHQENIDTESRPEWVIL
jgi:hypothetical protein